MRVPSRVRRGRARDTGVVQRPGDPGSAVPGQPLREHPPHHRSCHRVRLEAVRPPAPRGVRLVRVRPRIREPVPVRRPATQVPALLQGLRGHRGTDPDPGPGNLPLRRQAQREHRLLVILGVPIDTAAHLRHPQRDPVVLEQRRHRRVLVPVERPLVLPDHDRVPPPVRIRQRRHQSRGLRTPRPRQRAARPGVEEPGHDLAVPGHQHIGLMPLPRPRRHRILPVLGLHPPVKREPQPAAAWHAPAAQPGPLRPQHQSVPARSPAGSRFPVKRRGHHPPASQTRREPPIASASPITRSQSGNTPPPRQKRHNRGAEPAAGGGSEQSRKPFSLRPPVSPARGAEPYRLARELFTDSLLPPPGIRTAVPCT